MEETYYRTDEVAALIGRPYDIVFQIRKRAGVKPVRFKGSQCVWYTQAQVDRMIEVMLKPWLAVDAQPEEAAV